MKLPAMARYMSKMVVREATVKRLASCLEKDTETFVQFALSAPVQKGLGKYLESLAKRG